MGADSPMRDAGRMSDDLEPGRVGAWIDVKIDWS